MTNTVFAYSSDGETFTPGETLPYTKTKVTADYITYGNGMYMAVGTYAYGTPNQIFVKKDM